MGYDIVCKIIPKEYWFGYRFDYLLMMMRYVLPMIHMCFVSPMYLIRGFRVALIYAHCWTMYEKETWMFDGNDFNGRATFLAEVLSGFMFGFISYAIMTIFL